MILKQFPSLPPSPIPIPSQMRNVACCSLTATPRNYAPEMTRHSFRISFKLQTELKTQKKKKKNKTINNV